VRDYVVRLQRGDTIDRDVAAGRAERDRITQEYAELLDDEPRASFEGKLRLARQVYPYVENHNFYIEHWSMSVFWRKMRELSRVLQREGFWAAAEDMFYINRDELRQVLFDYASAWAVGVEPVGPSYWPGEIARRRKIVQALSSARPQPALSQPPAVITEPFTIMLWGITSERIDAWLGCGGEKSGVSCRYRALVTLMKTLVTTEPVTARFQAAILRPITMRLLQGLGLSPGMKILDVGCGAGDVALLAAELVGESGEVVGIDRSESAIRAARARAATAKTSTF
jgi:hypothetical protein